MARYGWLTPDSSPVDVVCRSLFIPNSEAWVAIVTGAILELSQPYNWEEYGALTPVECAERMQVMLDEFTFQLGNCHMIGELIAYAGASSPLPSQWLLCDGSSISRIDYPDLFAVIGTAYGAIDTAHFSLPDLRGVVLMGQGNGFTLAAPVGEYEHTLTLSEMPTHSHTEIAATSVLINGGLEAPASSAVPTPSSTGSAGLGTAHNNIQPSMPITYLIYAKDR